MTGENWFATNFTLHKIAHLHQGRDTLNIGHNTPISRKKSTLHKLRETLTLSSDSLHLLMEDLQLYCLTNTLILRCYTTESSILYTLDICYYTPAWMFCLHC